MHHMSLLHAKSGRQLLSDTAGTNDPHPKASVRTIAQQFLDNSILNGTIHQDATSTLCLLLALGQENV